jgi:Mn-dependent DtxR family transcriptional regulator
MMPFTPKQGQYLAFIYYYTKIHGQAPAEADMEKFFRVSPPSVHQMVLRLEQARLISRIPGVARSIRLRVGKDDIPPLD